MNCCITELNRKEVINQRDGCSLGCVSDVEIDTCTGQLVSIVVLGKWHVGTFGKNSDIKISWQDIRIIGDDTILVDIDSCGCCEKCEKKGFLEGMFR